MENYKCIARIRIKNTCAVDGSDFGHGIAALLTGVEECGSLNKAAKDMGMAYSKAWKSIKNTEKELGFELLERRAQHGSVLTEKGSEFLMLFRLAEEKAQLAAQEVFEGFGK